MNFSHIFQTLKREYLTSGDGLSAVRKVYMNYFNSGKFKAIELRVLRRELFIMIDQIENRHNR